MTIERRDGREPSPFHAWVRGHPELDSIRECLCISDSDLWVQRYGYRKTRYKADRRVQYLMLVEVKSHGRDVDKSQRDLLAMVNDLLRTNAWRDQRIDGQFIVGHPQNTRAVYSYIERNRVRLYCYGVHKLRMSGATPQSSEWMTWSDGNGIERPITEEQLVKLLKFDLNPDSLRPMEHREHKRIIRTPVPLFDVPTPWRS